MRDAGSRQHPAEEGSFSEAWEVADRIEGWLSQDQGRLLWSLASAVPRGGRVVEIGSHKGRSTVVLGFAAMTAGARVTAIDPFVDGAMFGGKATRSVFEDHIRDSGLTDVVDLLPIPSSDARRHWTAPIDFLYIDGKHDYWSVVDDLRWLPLLAPNARVGIHDAFCSVGVTSALIDRALIRGELRYEGRMSTLAVFRPGRPSGSQRRNFTRQMPWFTRNVVIKAARRLNARPVVRALGHNDPWDPY